MSQDLERVVREIVAKIVAQQMPAQEQPLEKPVGMGIFADIDQAIRAAQESQRELMKLPLVQRRQIIAAMRSAALEHAEAFSKRAVEESGLGNVGDKIQKNKLAAEATPGVEDLEPQAFTSEHGMTLVERAPYGVIGAIIPVTNPTATVINNGIGMVAAGNSVVFNPHPSAKGVSSYAVTVMNEAIHKAGGPKHLLTAVSEPTIESANQMMKDQRIAILVVTGGPGVVKAAMNSGKKVIAAGPGNPPCVVDETAHIEKAAQDIGGGASFDNNLVCICEKEVLVVETVASKLIEGMAASGAYIMDAQQTKAVTDLVIEKPGGPGREGVIQKKFVGKHPSVIAQAAGFKVPEHTKLLVCKVEKDHPLVWTEQLMPVLPVVSLPDVDQCIELAVQCEHGFRHTAMMHSLNVEKLSKMAKAMNCSLFVKNGPCYAGLGHGGAGFTSFTIASPTGEGLTRARTFTRERRCTLVDYFRIV